jgi:mannose-6-phosphate isomerase-like protein (cupin superfamily)
MATAITRRSAVAGMSAVFVGSTGTAQSETTAHRHRASGSAQKEQQGFKFLALKMFVEVDSDDTMGSIAVVRVFVPPGAGAAPHVHSREDEVHAVVRGHYRYRHGDEEVDAPAGTVIYMPRGIPHTFRNIGDQPGEHLLTIIPGGLEKLFQEASAAQVRLPQDKARYDELSAKYGVRNLPPDALPFSL